jgi:hypothetical protein
MGMYSMVRGVEVWLPHGEWLRFDTGAFDGADAFAKASVGVSFRRGEGLPGAVWATARALCWKGLNSNFVHAEHAAAGGIDVGLGFPIVSGDRFIASVVIYLTSNPRSGGCLEIWNVDEARSVLRHAGGHYVACADLERISHLLQFQRGVGLPGQVWRRGVPVLMPNIARESSFIRSSVAQQIALERGLGIPIGDGRDVSQVLTMLARVDEPFLRSAEIWRLSARDATLVGAAGSSMPPETTIMLGEMLVGRVAQSSRPCVVAGSAGGPPKAAISLGLPVFGVAGLTHVIILKF